MDIDNIASDIYYLDSVDDVSVEDGEDRGTYYIDVTLRNSNRNLESFVSQIVEDAGGVVIGVDDSLNMVTFFVDLS